VTLADALISGQTAVSLAGAVAICYTIARWAWLLAARLQRLEDALQTISSRLAALEPEAKQIAAQIAGMADIKKRIDSLACALQDCPVDKKPKV
jgi:hypothetical protein